MNFCVKFSNIPIVDSITFKNAFARGSPITPQTSLKESPTFFTILRRFSIIFAIPCIIFIPI